MVWQEMLPPRFRRGVPDVESDDHSAVTEAQVDHEKSFGVRRMEAIAASFTIYDKVALFVAIFLVACTAAAIATLTHSLDGNGRKSFQATAIAEWDSSANTAMLGVVRSCVAAASLPVYAKVSDWFGRSSIFLAIVTFYVIGTIVQATSNNFHTYTGGYILYILGFAGEHVLFQILIGDSTSLRSRLIFAYVPTLPQLINTWVSGTIASRILEVSTWRWGFAMWTIIMPCVALPLFFSLYGAEYRSKKKGLLKDIPSTRTIVSTPAYWIDFFWKADIVGLFLLAASWALVLIPLTLGGGTSSKWKTAPVLSPLFVGLCVTFPSFIIWEAKLSRFPLLPWSLLKNRHILASFGIALFSTVSQSVQSTYLYYTLIVSFGKSVEAATRTANVESFCEVIVGVLVGFAVRRFRVLKPFIIFGACLYVVAYGLLFKYRGGHTQADFAGLVGGEVVLGFAGGFSLTPVQVGLQASVGHEKMAVITALFLTAFTTGSAIGSTVAGAIWTNTLPARLAANLEAIGTANATTYAKQVYGNPLKFVQANPVGTETRTAVEMAYRSVQQSLCTAGICLSAMLVVFSLMLNWVELDDRQNKEDKEDIAVNDEKLAEADGAGGAPPVLPATNEKVQPK